MGSLPPAEGERRPPHVVMVPYPAQGHVTPMLQLAKLLHARGFHVTFVNNEFNHRRHLRARGPRALDGAPGFRFAAIDDGLPRYDADATQDVPALCRSTMTTCLPRFKGLIARLNAEAEGGDGEMPPVTCVVGDSTMTFALRAARELGLRCATLWTASACGFIGYYHYRHLVERGLVPLKDEAQLCDGYLDTTVVDWIPGAPRDGLRLRDFPSFVRTTDPDDIMLNFFIHETAAMSQASAVVINTFDELEAPLLDAMAELLPPVYTVGPLPLTVRNNVPDDSPVAAIGSNLWKEQDAPLRWLDGRAPRSVVYVNFGSITVMSNEQLAEFAWGLANTGYAFLWNVRPDLVKGDESPGLPPEFAAATEGRSMLSTWCPQAAVLAHEAVGVFLTHSGWNSTLESICGGVPMVCWPFFAEQQTNCRYKRTEWGIGMEVGDEVRRTEVEALIREAMEGEKGQEMRRRVAELRESAVAAARPGGRSMRNVDRLIDEVLQH
ncbi:UDP-glycosyltransferase 85A2-like [Phragmites australis]|uniref:UDP-glycosyltransferase 85A2-like n=1 Tax=Phragmites australis TaxID=29695 RepID=UPI002D78C67D|nr:UDP-glycosyltransferase 85A2-like [Phragmites australis]